MTGMKRIAAHRDVLVSLPATAVFNGAFEDFWIPGPGHSGAARFTHCRARNRQDREGQAADRTKVTPNPEKFPMLSRPKTPVRGGRRGSRELTAASVNRPRPINDEHL
jgi:hypothetical protein